MQLEAKTEELARDQMMFIGAWSACRDWQDGSLLWSAGTPLLSWLLSRCRFPCSATPWYLTAVFATNCILPCLSNSLPSFNPSSGGHSRHRTFFMCPVIARWRAGGLSLIRELHVFPRGCTQPLSFPSLRASEEDAIADPPIFLHLYCTSWLLHCFPDMKSWSATRQTISQIFCRVGCLIPWPPSMSPSFDPPPMFLADEMVQQSCKSSWEGGWGMTWYLSQASLVYNVSLQVQNWDICQT